MKVGIQGIKGAFHEVAAHKYFGESIQIVEHRTFEELICGLNIGSTDKAIMAIENSIAGSLLSNYALMRDNEVTVIGEVFLNIQMCLLTKKEVPLNEICKVESHPIALQQCRSFINEHLSHALCYESFDTAGSASILKGSSELTTAVIASERCAELYNLHIAARSIETNKQNFTRFLVLQNKNALGIHKGNKATLSFQLNHNPGSLSAALQLLSEYKINLTKIQSIPIIGKPYQYNFHVDLEFRDLERLEGALKILPSLTVEHKLFGVYEKASFELNN